MTLKQKVLEAEKMFVMAERLDPQLKDIREIELGELYNEFMTEKLLKNIDNV